MQGRVHHRRRHPPEVPEAFNTEGDTTYREIPADIDTKELMVTHGGFDNSDINKDVNAMFPLDRLRELVAEGYIGSLTPEMYGFMGGGGNIEVYEKQTGPEIARKLKEQGTDIVLCTGGCGTCHRTATIVTRACEEAGMSCIVIAALAPVAQQAGAPRIAAAHVPIGSNTGAPNDREMQMGILKDSLQCIETPAGLIRITVQVKDGHAERVDLVNVPAFVYQEDVVLDVPTLGKVRFDLCFGGNFYAIVRAEDIGVPDIDPANASLIIEQAMKLRRVIDAELPLRHPTMPHITRLEGIQVIGPPKSEDADAQCCIVFGDGKIDRSPCGTATSSRLALEHTKGRLAVGERFVNESIIRSRFTGTVLKEVQVTPEIRGIVPMISGTAYVIAQDELLFDDRDPLREGFVLG